jgi:lipoate-protein ligase A
VALVSGPFTVCTVRSTVSEAHQLAFPDPPARQLWFVEPTDAAVVLGSTQGIAALDLGVVAARGLSVVRRRSGGGAVVVEPGELTWFDVLLPAGDARWRDDVGESAAWVGETVAEALRAVGVDASAPVRVPVRSPWSSLVCFAGMGAGEIGVAGRKVVGISQRRTRAAARFQVSVLHRFDAVATAALFRLDDGERTTLAQALDASVASVDVAPSALRSALEDAFAAR